MNDQELRALVRDAVARHMGRQGQPAQAAASFLSPAHSHSAHDADSGTTAWTRHASHALYLTVVNTAESCFIEPSTTCDHCGYCKSHGH